MIPTPFALNTRLDPTRLVRDTLDIFFHTLAGGRAASLRRPACDFEHTSHCDSECNRQSLACAWMDMRVHMYCSQEQEYLGFR